MKWVCDYRPDIREEMQQLWLNWQVFGVAKLCCTPDQWHYAGMGQNQATSPKTEVWRLDTSAYLNLTTPSFFHGPNFFEMPIAFAFKTVGIGVPKELFEVYPTSQSTERSDVSSRSPEPASSWKLTLGSRAACTEDWIMTGIWLGPWISNGFIMAMPSIADTLVRWSLLGEAFWVSQWSAIDPAGRPPKYHCSGWFSLPVSIIRHDQPFCLNQFQALTVAMPTIIELVIAVCSQSFLLPQPSLLTLQ